MVKPTLPYTKQELAWIESTVARNMADRICPISEDLSREICCLKLAADACGEFIAAGMQWVEKYGKGF